MSTLEREWFEKGKGDYLRGDDPRYVPQSKKYADLSVAYWAGYREGINERERESMSA